MTDRGAGCEKDACPVLRGAGAQLWWTKYCGTAGKPGGNGEDKPRPRPREAPAYSKNLLVRTWRGVRREAHNIMRSAMTAPVKPSQQPGTESCVVRGSIRRKGSGTTTAKRRQGGDRPQRK